MKPETKKNKLAILAEYEELMGYAYNQGQSGEKSIETRYLEDMVAHLRSNVIETDIEAISQKRFEEKKARKITGIKKTLSDNAESFENHVNNMLDDDKLNAIASTAVLLMIATGAASRDFQSMITYALWSLPAGFISVLFVLSIGVPLRKVSEFIKKHYRVDIEVERNNMYEQLADIFSQYMVDNDKVKFKNSMDQLVFMDEETKKFRKEMLKQKAIDEAAADERWNKMMKEMDSKLYPKNKDEDSGFQL